MRNLIIILLISICVDSFSQVYIQKKDVAVSEKISIYKEEKVIDLNKPPFNIFDNKSEIEERLKSKGLDNIYKVELPMPVDGDKFKSDLRKRADVKHVFGEIEFIELGYTPNDTYYSTQWALNNLTPGAIGLDMDMELAWEKEKGDTNVIVGIMEHGFSITHPDLVDNIHYLKGYNFDTWEWTILPSAHPTAIAGMISAETNNSLGVAGIAGGSGSGDGVRLLSISIRGSGAMGHIAGWIWAAEMGVSIVNCSFGTSFINSGDSIHYSNAMQYFIDYGGAGACDGGIIVAAAGNDEADNIIFPARDPLVIAVAALQNNDVKTSYSNWNSNMDISAAGGYLDSPSGVRTTYYNEETETNEYIYYSGTSIATPLVSGAVALLVSYTYGEFTNDEIIYCLLNSTEDIDALNPSYAGKLGSGRVNAYQALLLADSILLVKNRPQLIFQF